MGQGDVQDRASWAGPCLGWLVEGLGRAGWDAPWWLLVGLGLRRVSDTGLGPRLVSDM